MSFWTEMDTASRAAEKRKKMLAANAWPTTTGQTSLASKIYRASSLLCQTPTHARCFRSASATLLSVFHQGMWETTRIVPCSCKNASDLKVQPDPDRRKSGNVMLESDSKWIQEALV
jgi:hypothetical protein